MIPGKYSQVTSPSSQATSPANTNITAIQNDNGLNQSHFGYNQFYEKTFKSGPSSLLKNKCVCILTSPFIAYTYLVSTLEANQRVRFIVHTRACLLFATFVCPLFIIHQCSGTPQDPPVSTYYVLRTADTYMVVAG